MSDTILTPASGPPVSHPLALELARALAGREPAPGALLLGVGSGRNIPVLLACGAFVEAVEPDERRARLARANFPQRELRITNAPFAGPYAQIAFAGALSTHALLHGREDEIAASIEAVRSALAPRGLLYATLGSTSDPRYGRGRAMSAGTYAPIDGSERGVPHTYFNACEARALLRGFDVETLEERPAAETAGRWAHSAQEARTLVHWFVRASARAT